MTALGAGIDMLAALANILDFTAALVLMGLLGRTMSSAFWLRAAPAALLFAAALSWAAMPTIWPRPPQADWPTPSSTPLELVKLAAAGACLLSGALVGASQRRREAFATRIVWGGLAWTALGLWLRQSDAGHVFGLERAPASLRFSGTLLNVNASACLFGMLALIALAVLRRELLSGRRLLTTRAVTRIGPSALALTACMTACAFTGSRFALVCTLGLALALCLAGAWSARDKPLRWIAPVVVILVVALTASGVTLARSASLVEDWRSRGRLLSHFTALAVRAPLHGYGLGSFDTVNARMQTPADAPLLWELAAAHNSILQAMIEGGWPWAALLCTAVCVVAAQGAWGLGAGAATGTVRSGFALAALLAALCSMVDIALEVPAVSAVTYAFLGVLWGAELNRAKSASQRVPGSLTLR